MPDNDDIGLQRTIQYTCLLVRRCPGLPAAIAPELINTAERLFAIERDISEIASARFWIALVDVRE